MGSFLDGIFTSELKTELSTLFYEKEKEQEIIIDDNIILGFKLYKQQWEWLSWLDSSTARVDMLLGARRYGKSEAITIFYSILKAVKENKKIGIVTKKFNRGAKFLRQIRAGLLKCGVELEIANSNNIFIKGNKTKEANINAITINQVIKGMHLDIIICDDIVDEQDEHSAAELENTIDFYKNVINITKKIIIIGQPVTETDLYAVLKGAEGVNILECFYGCIPELDKSINLESLRNLGIPERNIQRNYYGLLIADKDLPFADLEVANFDIKENAVATIDPAFGGGDKVGMTIGYKDYSTNKILCKLYEFVGDVYNLKNEILNILKQNGVYKCFIESNDGGGVLRDFKQTGAGNSIYFKGFRETKNKETRILSRIGRFKNRLIIGGAVKQVINYNSKLKTNDDVVDSLASFLNLVDGNVEGVKEL
jgi:hypothetical protein